MRANDTRSARRSPESNSDTRITDVSVSSTRCDRVGQRRYMVVLATPARSATAAIEKPSYPRSAISSAAAAKMA